MGAVFLHEIALLCFYIWLLKSRKCHACIEIRVALRVLMETWTDNLVPEWAGFCAETSPFLK